MEDYAALPSREDDLGTLTAAVQRLKHFKLSPERPAVALLSGTVAAEMEYPNRYLRAVLDTNNLETIFMNFSFLWQLDAEPSAFTLGSLITFRQWPKLRHLNLSKASLHFEELKKFVESMPTQLYLLSLYSMDLLSGTWAEALDVLRNTTKLAIMQGGSGAELDELSVAEKDAIFEKPTVWSTEWRHALEVENKVEAYIIGRSEQNPFRDAPLNPEDVA